MCSKIYSDRRYIHTRHRYLRHNKKNSNKRRKIQTIKEKIPKKELKSFFYYLSSSQIATTNIHDDYENFLN